MTAPPLLTIEQLRAEIESGAIDTVITAITDMQGRLQGKRNHGHYFLDHVLGHGVEGCNYLLAVDVDMTTVEGYAISSWDRGYGDMLFEMDMSTLRRTPGQPYSATVQCDLLWMDGTGQVRPAPRSVLKSQAAAAAELGCVAIAGTELEFIVFEDSFDAAWDRRYQGLTGANRYNVDYSILGGTRVEPLLREIRNEMYAAGVVVENAKGGVQPGPARDRVPVRRGRPHLRQPQRLQECGQGDRGGPWPVADLHGQVRPARGQLLPYPSLATWKRRHDGLRRRQQGRWPEPDV